MAYDRPADTSRPRNGLLSNERHAVIRERAYPVDPWHIRETRLDLDLLAQSESVFALANGHIGLRGNLDEGEPHGLPGTYLNSFYELRPLPYAEAGYGFPESGQTIVNVTNAKPMRLLVDDEPFDVRYGELRSHERVLDLRAGTLERTVEWVSPAGQAVRVRSTRLVSFTQRAVVAICYEVEPLDASARLILQSELVANEQLPPTSKDPRVAAVLDHPLQAEEMLEQRTGGLLIHRTKASNLRMAAAMEHTVETPGKHAVTTEGHPDWLRTTVACKLEPGQKLRVVKLAAYGWSSKRSLPALRDQVGAALASARLTGWEGLVEAQRRVPGRLLGPLRRQGRGRPRGAAGGPLRAVPHAAGRRPGGEAADRCQGPDRSGVRRPHVLGRGDVRPAGADLHAAGCRRGRAALAAQHPAVGPGAGADLGPAGGGLPVADHPRARVFGVLAGRHGGFPHRRGHRRRGASLRAGHRRPRLRA